MDGTNLAGGGQTGSFGKDGGPSGEIYGGMEVAYRWFNERLFGSKLPGVVFTLHRGSAMSGSVGYYHAQRFGRRKQTEGRPVDEIAMNPTYFGHQTVQEVMSTLCHEMAHAYQNHFMRSPRSNYHCRVFAELMLKIGLPTSDTGLPGGNPTGQRMQHMIQKGGAFQRAFEELADAEFLIGWYERFPRNALQGLPTVVVEKNEVGEWVVTEDSLQQTARVLARNREIADRFATQGGSVGLLRTVVDEIVNNVPPKEVAEKLTTETLVAAREEARALRLRPERGKSGTRVRYQCPHCEVTVWGKSGLKVLCGEHMGLLKGDDSDAVSG